MSSAEGEEQRSIFRSTPRSTNYKAHMSFPPISGEESDVSPGEAQSPFRLSSFQHFVSFTRTRWQSEDNFTRHAAFPGKDPVVAHASCRQVHRLFNKIVLIRESFFWELLNSETRRYQFRDIISVSKNLRKIWEQQKIRLNFWQKAYQKAEFELVIITTQTININVLYFRKKKRIYIVAIHQCFCKEDNIDGIAFVPKHR